MKSHMLRLFAAVITAVLLFVFIPSLAHSGNNAQNPSVRGMFPAPIQSENQALSQPVTSMFSVLTKSETLPQTPSVTGTFPALAGEPITLIGFNGFENYTVASTRASDAGQFSLPYTLNDRGMAFLVDPNDNSYLIVLSGEQIVLQGESFSNPESVDILSSQENRLFEQYASEHPRREQAMSAWVYLNNIYQNDPLFSAHETPVQAIQAEQERIRREDNAFLSNLDPDMYIHWYLPVRRLVTSVPVVAQFSTEEIPATIQGFRDLDHADPRLYRSGLLKDVLESHVWLIENSGRQLPDVFTELNRSLDVLTDQLTSHPERFNELMGFLFDFMEQRSLFTSSEYLALKLLENHGDILTNRVASRLERYRAVRIGNTAPDIQFTEHSWRPDGFPADIQRLSDVEAAYTLVVFAAGWCPHCREMMPNLNAKSIEWKQHGVEVVMVSLDDSTAGFERFVAYAPFLVTTDFQRWNTPAARAYHIQSVPSMFLLDQNMEILLRPNSVNHMDSWVDWFLVQGNSR